MAKVQSVRLWYEYVCGILRSELRWDLEARYPMGATLSAQNMDARIILKMRLEARESDEFGNFFEAGNYFLALRVA